MSETTVLIIDDSATIRRLVDHCLTAAGYRVVSASTAEDGLEFAGRESPDLILLDHQLPGTTGKEVATQLLDVPAASQVPVVVSSTLRKKAYAEYLELPNVVDMLPKPYTEELLTTTVENALSTAAMVVDSQAQGTAVPEVLQQRGEPEFSGRLNAFSVREVLDFLNNASKVGVLEIEGDGYRVFFALDKGRVIGVSSSGVEADEVTRTLPASLQNLAPIVNLTIGGRGGSELDGLVELLNRKVVDPRLLKKLLRHQAAVLAWKCFGGAAREFRFTQSSSLPPLAARLPLDVSVLALLIDAALCASDDDLPQGEQPFSYARRAVRGQNMDRAGVSAQHIKALNSLSDRRSASEVAQAIGCTVEEAVRVLFALERADLVERTTAGEIRDIVIYEPDALRAGKLRESLSDDESSYRAKVVRDAFALQLVLRRSQPSAFVVRFADDTSFELVRAQQESGDAGVKWIGVTPSGEEEQSRSRLGQMGLYVDEIVHEVSDPGALFAVLDRVFANSEEPGAEQEVHEEMLGVN